MKEELYKIFDDHFLDIFVKWMADLAFAEIAPEDYKDQWEEFIKEKNIIRSKEILPNYTTIQCPEDKELYLNISNEYAQQVINDGKII
jgi:hypothetical protein